MRNLCNVWNWVYHGLCVKLPKEAGHQHAALADISGWASVADLNLSLIHI